LSLLGTLAGLGKTLQTLGLILANPPPGIDYAAAAQKYAELQRPAAAAAAAAEEEPDTRELPKQSMPDKTAIQKVKAPLLRQILRDHAIALSLSSKKDVMVKACVEALQSGAMTLAQYHAGLDKPLAPSDATTTTAAASSGKNRPTMIVCPVSVASNWMEQVEMHVKPGALRIAMYAGTNREDILSQLAHLDVIVVSYNTLAHDYTKYFAEGAKGSGQPSVKKVKRETIFDRLFHRIILDEGHTIRNTKTRNYKAVMKIQATCKICLTGTPMQNSASDIMSLFAFLNVEPLHQPDVFRRAITQPIMGGDMAGLDRLRAMMSYVALRRTKSIINLKMANKSVELRSVNFPLGLHKNIHDALFESARGAFAATLAMNTDEGAALKNYNSIFEVLLRIRQACCSGAMVPKERWQRAMAVVGELKNRENGKPLTAEEGAALLERLKGALEAEDAYECAVCLCEIEESAAVILRTCSHVYCEPCLSRVATGGHGKCPLCRHDFEAADMIKKTTAAAAVQTSAAEKTGAEIQELGVAPKVLAMMEALTEMKTDEKGIIFSQFTSFLDEIQTCLQVNGHTFTRIDGSMSAPRRIEAMRAFSDDNGPRLILCSLKACGTGINLTRANHVFMMDTWWNKAVEDQAQDRCHRLGQTRDVRICRFVMADTIEERMISLQEAKAAIGKGAMQKLKPKEVRAARLGMFRRIFDLPSASEAADNDAVANDN
jgi:SWI/SNF-related matrix-associated actin-dependent regulator of chromatin subfamily A3